MSIEANLNALLISSSVKPFFWRNSSLRPMGLLCTLGFCKNSTAVFTLKKNLYQPFILKY